MVNVAGRSKGCSTCRRRRVKCDETRPVCMRCLRCGFECEGAKDTTFVEGKILNSRRTERTALPARYHAGDKDSAYLQIPPSVSLKGMEIEIYICYTRRNLRHGVVDIALQDAQLSDIVTAGTTTANGQIFYQAVRSFATILFGNQHRQTSICAQGYSMHGVALKQLNQALSDSKCYTRDEVILSVVALALLECFVPTGPKYYLKHMAGLERLLELRDPALYCSPKTFELYKCLRPVILFASLRTGRPSILARAEWKKAFRANCSDEEMQENDLFDVLADCTVLIAKRDNLLANRELDLERDTHQRDKIKRGALALLTHLRAWRKQWDSDGSNSHLKTSAAFARLQPTQKSLGDDSSPFPAVFEFPDDSAATMLMFYNTVLIYVLRILTSLTPETLGIPSNQSLVPNTLQDDGYLDGLREYTKDEYIAAERLAALEVCRCVPNYLVHKSRSEASHSAVVYLSTTAAWMTLRGNESAEGRWMTDLLNTKSQLVVANGLWAG